MKLLESEDSIDDTDDDEDVDFEKVNKFQYLGVILNVKNLYVRRVRLTKNTYLYL